MVSPRPPNPTDDYINSLMDAAGRQDVYRAVRTLLESGRTGRVGFEFRFPAATYSCTASLSGDRIKVDNAEDTRQGKVTTTFYIHQDGAYSFDAEHLNVVKGLYEADGLLPREATEEEKMQRTKENIVFYWDTGTSPALLGGDIDNWVVNRHGGSLRLEDV